jgi:hypothetical protein
LNTYTSKKAKIRWFNCSVHSVKLSKVFLILFLLLLIVWEVNAEKLDILPTLVITGGYDDNILFTRTKSIGDSYIKAKPGLDVTVSSEQYDIGLDIYGEVYRYLEAKELDVENYKFNFDGGYNLSSHWSLRGRAYYLKDTTLDSELDETGRVGIRENRERYLASGQLGYNLDEVSLLRLDYAYTKTNYESEARVNRDVQDVALGYERWINNRVDRISITPSYNWALVEQGTEYDYYRLSGGWTHIFSKTLRMRNILGYGYTETTQGKNTNTNQVWNADLSLTKSAETTSLKIGFRSDIRLDSFGDLFEVDRLYLNFRYNLTERFRMLFYGSYYVSRPIEIFDRADRAYFVLRPALTYNMTRYHTLSLRYRYQNEYNYEVDVDPQKDRNVIELTLNFSFPIQK